MGPATAYKVSFRVFHPTVRAEEIVARVGLRPRIVRSVGDARATPKGTPLEGINQRTSVVFDLEEFESVIGLEQTLKIVTRDVAANAGSYLPELVETGGRAEFFIGVFCDENVGVDLDATLIRSLASAGIAVGFDIYPPDGTSGEGGEADPAAGD
jgi:hypothetical protein